MQFDRIVWISSYAGINFTIELLYVLERRGTVQGYKIMMGSVSWPDELSPHKSIQFFMT